MNNDTTIMILLTGGLLILDTLPARTPDFSPVCSPAECGVRMYIRKPCISLPDVLLRFTSG
ncbi:hypothetical protein Barb6XT_02846 [Bacteroidales bacterium Barb6XT]|nr:hypothetical protein Barb6XT_02846 [Bacteroidales bacterium Barb6XT]